MVPGALKAWGGVGTVPGAPGEPEQRCRGSQGTRGEVLGGSWGTQGRCGWGGVSQGS